MPYRLRGCPKCGGALCVEADADYGEVATCLQCGYVAYPTLPLPLIQERRNPRHEGTGLG